MSSFKVVSGIRVDNSRARQMSTSADVNAGWVVSTGLGDDGVVGVTCRSYASYRLTLFPFSVSSHARLRRTQELTERVSFKTVSGIRIDNS